MKLKFGIVGCGKLGGIVARAVEQGLLPDYELTALFSRTRERAEELSASLTSQPKVCGSIEELLEMGLDYIVEAASPACMRAIALPALKRGISVITLSIGAFADEDYYAEVAHAARQSGAKVYIASGATGGFDVLRTATLMGGATARFFNEKGPNALKGTPVYEESLQKEQKVVFSGTAKEAIEKFPTRVNVTVAASRASVGPENLKVEMQSSPYFRGDTQRVEIRNPQVHAVVDVYSATSEIAAWSVVAVMQNITSPIVF